MFTRRTATVTMSAPDASCARRITVKDEYFPVPTMSRDRNSRPAITRVSSIVGSRALSATDEVHDLHLIPVANLGRVVLCALDDVEIMFHGDAARVDAEMLEQRAERQRSRHVDAIAV